MYICVDGAKPKKKKKKIEKQLKMLIWTALELCCKMHNGSTIQEVFLERRR
jgi:hypothetical protein